MTETITPDALAGIRKEEARYGPRIERAFLRFADRLSKEINQNELQDAIESGDPSRVMLLYKLAIDNISTATFDGLLTDAVNSAGKVVEKEINNAL